MDSANLLRRKIVAIDLFCGAGGLTRGLLNAGISVAIGIDSNAAHKETYEANNSPAKFLCRDIADISKADLLPFLAQQGDFDLALVGCAPCQTFSSHRRRRSRCSESHLLREFGRLVEEFKPQWVFMENVPGLAKVRGFSTLLRFKHTLVKSRFQFDCNVVDAKRFGVPQTRRRFVLFASRLSSVSLPAPTHGPGLIPYRTVRDAISHFPPLRAGHTSKSVPNHRAARISKINMNRLKQTPTNGGGRLDWPKTLELECHKETEGHEDVYGRMHWDLPAPTLTCRCFSISNGRYGHPKQNRAISLREAAALQTFPESYVFSGQSQRSLGEQIGNAVPVALAEAVGMHLVSLSKAVRQKKVPKSRSKVQSRG
jgi:DNA (cytosine-5)-methyltransferase 1